ncbi:GDP-mannose 4,6 dehydratase [Thelohanellus kitauei]|uniref:GDP-mannose 4,6-dehydratase n=1 Tax=Thelohanellus kitauei TaxID=669202 RepID=A0A0C2MUP7_THEKT|nr:GDP-mannose 4,6 dehydratase [Thelohanellus kitauei]
MDLIWPNFYLTKATKYVDLVSQVHGILRRSSSFNTGRIIHLYDDQANFYSGNHKLNFDRFRLHYGDLTDMSSLSHIIAEVEPDEIYNLGAQSHVKVGFSII